MERLSTVAQAAGSDPVAICHALSAEMIDGDAEDDVALVVARTVSPRTEEFEVRLPAISTSLAPLRRSMRQWIRENGGDDDDEIEILIAVGEAAGNAVEHAYGPGDASFDVIGKVSACDLEIAVRDYGSWRPPRGHNRGRGTQLMQQLMDEFEVRTTAEGTEVRMRRRLREGSRA